MVNMRSILVVITFVGLFSLFGAGSFVTGCSPTPNDEQPSEATTGGETTTAQDGANTTEQTPTETTTNTETSTTETTNSETVVETAQDAGPAPETVTDTSSSTLSYVTHIEPIWQKNNCLSGYCHGGVAGGLNLKTDGYKNLVDAKSTSGAWTRVVAGDTAKSLLYEKVSKDSPAEGGRMPQGGTLTADEIKTIGDWITQGAKP